MTRFWLWWLWRRLVVQAYLASHTDNADLMQDLEQQAKRAKNLLDDYDMNTRLGGLRP